MTIADDTNAELLLAVRNQMPQQRSDRSFRRDDTGTAAAARAPANGGGQSPAQLVLGAPQRDFHMTVKRELDQCTDFNTVTAES